MSATVRRSRASISSSMSSARQPSRAAERPRHGRLAGRHEADEVDLVGRHRVSARELVEEPGVRDVDRRRRRGWWSAPRAGWRRSRTPSPGGDRRRHRPTPPVERPRFDGEAVLVFVDLRRRWRGSQRASAEIRSLSLTRSSAAPRTVSFGPRASSRRAPRAPESRRSPRALRSGDLENAHGVAGGEPQRADRLAGVARPRSQLSTHAPARRSIVEDGDARRVQADAVDLDARPGVPAASATQNAAHEMSPGTVRRPRLKPLAARDGDRGTRRWIDRRRRTPRAPAPYDRGSGTFSMTAGRPGRVQARQQDAALDLRARHLGLVGNGVERSRRRWSAAAGRRSTRCGRPSASAAR